MPKAKTEETPPEGTTAAPVGENPAASADPGAGGAPEPAAPPLDLVALADLAAQIEAVRFAPKHLAELEARLVQEQGLEIGYDEARHGYLARMAGVEASAMRDKAAALANWANAARRRVYEGRQA